MSLAFFKPALKNRKNAKKKLSKSTNKQESYDWLKFIQTLKFSKLNND